MSHEPQPFTLTRADLRHPRVARALTVLMDELALARHRESRGLGPAARRGRPPKVPPLNPRVNWPTATTGATRD